MFTESEAKVMVEKINNQALPAIQDIILNELGLVTEFKAVHNHYPHGNYVNIYEVETNTVYPGQVATESTQVLTMNKLLKHLFEETNVYMNVWQDKSNENQIICNVKIHYKHPNNHGSNGLDLFDFVYDFNTNLTSKY